MEKIAINVQNLSKRYRIGMKEERQDTLAGAVINWFKTPVKNFRKLSNLNTFKQNGEADDIIWALRDVSFNVKEGEVLGIIGKNGAGKSTLLKILSKITMPSHGKAEIKGRVSSLLEVGTGFHEELTGRENVYLNGTILGMRKKEIDQKFDEIYDFSGIGKFIDTPIKRYSSGMKVRLAFSVAAHLEPEILIIDEVLAVGDADFQRKCLGKMGNVARGGRTVLFVSHNMGAILQLCDRLLWLENGSTKKEGHPHQIVSAYLSQGSSGKSEWYNNPNENSKAPDVRMNSVKLTYDDNNLTSLIDYGRPFNVEFDYSVHKSVENLSLCFQIFNSQGILVYESLSTDVRKNKNRVLDRGRYKTICYLSDSLLLPDRYTISVASFIDNLKLFEKFEHILTFDITEIGYDLNLNRSGVVSPVFEWEIINQNNLEIITG